MVLYKGYDLPKDFGLIISAFGKIIINIYWIKVNTPQDFIQSIQKKVQRKKRYDEKEGQIRLEKMRRAVNFFLIRLVRHPRPCLIRSCILYEQALQCGMNVELMIGVKHEKDNLIGHSWIIIDNRPYKEDATMLKDYTIMMMG